jgi:hypothetical protein
MIAEDSDSGGDVISILMIFASIVCLYSVLMRKLMHCCIEKINIL